MDREGAAEKVAADLQHPSSRVRAAAAAKLGTLDDAGSDALLLAALRDPSREVRLISTQALVKRDPNRAAQPIVEALRDSPAGTPYEPAELREMLELGLYDLAQLRPVPRFIEALDSPDAVLRGMAAKVLGSIGDPAAVEPLVKTLGDPVEPVRNAARDALARMRDDRATDALERLASQERGLTRWRARRAARRSRIRE